MKRWPVVPALAALAFASGCGRDDRAERLLDLDVGVHRLTVQRPAGWVYHNDGDEHGFRSGSAQIALADRGAIPGAGFAVRLRRVHELWQQGRTSDALSAMRRINLSPEMFATPEDYRIFSDDWQSFLLALRDRTANEAALQARYEEFSAVLRGVADRYIRDVLPGVLVPSHFNGQRAIASIDSKVLHGRPLVGVHTWDRLSHGHLKRYALVLNEGSLLVIWTALGKLEEAESAFQTLIDSLEFREPSRLPTRGAA